VIYAFHSPKGGAGRSMALANVALLLHARGLRVLVVDEDFDAPGIETCLFDEKADAAALAAARARTGLVDLLHALRDGKGADVPVAASPLAAFIECIQPPAAEGGGLYLLGAGARGDAGQYAASVQKLDVNAAPDSDDEAGRLREWMLAAADVVLVDARAGVLGAARAVASRHADADVVFCTTGAGQIDDVVRDIALRAGARDDTHTHTVVVLARVDESDAPRAQAYAERLAAAVDAGEGAVAGGWRLRIPYVPDRSYGASRVAGAGAQSHDPAGRTLAAAYERLAAHLAALAPPGHPLRDALRTELRAVLPALADAPLQMVASPPATWVERPREVGALKEAILAAAASGHGTVVVTGGPGTGKSTLVARVCHDAEVIAAFPGGIVLVDARRRGDAGRAVLHRLDARANTDDEARTPLLVVVDDVRDAREIPETMPPGTTRVYVAVTGDRALAARLDAPVVETSALAPDEAARLLGPGGLPAPDGSPHAALARAFGTWALGASLLRAARERRARTGETQERVQRAVEAAFARHGVLAFDPVGPDARGPSVGRSMRKALAATSPAEMALLLRLAGDAARPGAGEPGTLDRDALARLQDLGLIVANDAAEGAGARIAPLVLSYLAGAGEIAPAAPGARGRGASSSDDKRARAGDIERAKAILRGDHATLDEIEALASRLLDARYFGYARRLYARARRDAAAAGRPPSVQLALAQCHAHCTYHDLDLPARERFGDALQILHEADLGSDEPSARTLGLAGAICKHRWKSGGRRADLEQALGYYTRAAARGIGEDLGYAAVNAAYVLDVLAHGEQGGSPATAARRVAEARALRARVRAELPRLLASAPPASPALLWSCHATLAEAAFGLGEHDEARYWLREGIATDPPEWELETTTRQLVALALAQEQDLREGTDAFRVLRVLVRDGAAGLGAIALGKVGLALSGGGFRASLFHVGVLARMAELDLLRHVEVLSCVSGGSIVGAHYYLEVRRLLHAKADHEITRTDYVEIVERVARDLMEAVRENLRTRLFVAWQANLRSLVQPGYTRTTHLGELFERRIFARVDDGHRKGPRWMDDLRIVPKGATPDFNPKFDNWRRSAKAPILLLNATTLNTGHNWQFAVSWMGEPPLGAGSTVDRNDILRRLYYWEAPPRHRHVRLGQAVAASAAVAGLFDPIELNGLFPDRSVRLVDGGVHDNQGTTGLIEQECSVVIVSDASGQANTVDNPSGELPAVAMRSNTILMGRVREAEFRELDLMHQSSALSGFAFLHLKKDLVAHQRDWVGCDDPYETIAEARPQAARAGRASPTTYYGVPRTVQTRLAGVRTDLDCFCEAEAYALMLSGYRMASADFKERLGQWPVDASAAHPWPFLAVAPAVDGPPHGPGHARLLRLLSASASRGFKVWRFVPRSVAWLVPAAAAALLLALALVCGLFEPENALRLIRGATVVLAAAGAATALIWLLHRAFGSRKSVSVIVTGLVLISVGWLVALVQLALLDPIYLRLGRVRSGQEKRRVGDVWGDT
jgi:predicted acylesterase/phospholipase RssA/MinD-like ATPase involved in chromosome partitioning or flagellar assembly